jgi:8-oxo-dGTP pyrophosphatase MutT (NUDIX family)
MEAMADPLRERLRAVLQPFDQVALQPEDADGRPAAVLIPVLERDDPAVVFTKRTDDLPRHPGEISFPGGLRHDEDADLLETALRETEEELGLSRSDVDVLGALDPFLTYTTGFWVTPVVGAVHGNPVFTPNPGEIAEVLEFPLSRLDAVEAEVEWRRGDQVWAGFVYELEGHTIWGATGRMLHELLEVLRKESPWTPV